jgi:hypothetical protein
MPTTKFYFANFEFSDQTSIYNISGSEELTREQALRNSMVSYVKSEEPVYEDDNSEWRFGRSIAEDDYIVGKFGRVFSDSVTTYDSDIDDFKQIDQSDIADVSYFVVFFEYGVVAYNTRQRIGYKQFINAFYEGYNNYYNTPDLLTLYPRKQSESIDTILQEAPNIQELEFELVPTNPEADEEMEELDNHIKNMNAGDFGMRAEASGEESLNTEDSLLNAAIQFVRNRYGDAKATFIRDGENIERRTKRRPMVQQTEEPEDIDELERQRRDFAEPIESTEDESTTSED